MNKKILLAPLLAGVALLGGASVALTSIASAQTPTTGTTIGTNSTSTPVGHMGRGMRHAPLGNDGTITVISGTTISMQEEADEGGAVYTVDASNATVTNKGTAATLSDLKVGDKIFVKGTTTGTSVVATNVSLGRPMGMGGRGHHMGYMGQKPSTQQQ